MTLGATTITLCPVDAQNVNIIRVHGWCTMSDTDRMPPNLTLQTFDYAIAIGAKRTSGDFQLVGTAGVLADPIRLLSSKI